jgi:hypothetical protein
MLSDFFDELSDFFDELPACMGELSGDIGKLSGISCNVRGIYQVKSGSQGQVLPPPAPSEEKGRGESNRKKELRAGTSPAPTPP